jgi:protein-disulfide isomerase
MIAVLLLALLCLILGWLVLLGMGGQGPLAGILAADPRVLAADIDMDDDPSLGPEDAPITIVEFSDFNCSYCGAWHREVFTALMEQYGDRIRFVYRDYPVVGGQTAAEAAECADEQGQFWAYHDALFTNQGQYSSVDQYVALAQDLELDGGTFRVCLESHATRDEVLADLEAGRLYGVRATPTFFINGRIMQGAYPIAEFQRIIDEELNQ